MHLISRIRSCRKQISAKLHTADIFALSFVRSAVTAIWCPDRALRLFGQRVVAMRADNRTLPPPPPSPFPSLPYGPAYDQSKLAAQFFLFLPAMVFVLRDTTFFVMRSTCTDKSLGSICALDYRTIHAQKYGTICSQDQSLGLFITIHGN